MIQEKNALYLSLKAYVRKIVTLRFFRNDIVKNGRAWILNYFTFKAPTLC